MVIGEDTSLMFRVVTQKMTVVDKCVKFNLSHVQSTLDNGQTSGRCIVLLYITGQINTALWVSFVKPMTHLKVFFRKSFSKATFARKLLDVAYTLAQVFTCESQLSEIKRVLYVKVFCRKR